MGLVTSVEQIEPRDQVGSAFASLPHKLGAAAALLFQTGAPRRRFPAGEMSTDGLELDGYVHAASMVSYLNLCPI